MPPRLGSHVRQLRLAAGLTQQQVADLAGMSVATLRDVEQGRIDIPRSATLRRLAQALRLPLPDAEEFIRCGQPGRFPAENLWLQILGPVTVHINGLPMDMGSVRQRQLLSTLALSANVPVSQERLIEVIWGSRPPTNVVELLRYDASRLRRRLRDTRDANGTPELAAIGGSYQLTVAGNQLDLLLFRRLAHEARQARQLGDPNRASRLLADSLALWRGAPLADLTRLRRVPPVVDLVREWETAVVEYAEIANLLGFPEDALPLLRRVVDENPLHEAAGAQLLTALTRSGQAPAALAMYDQLRRRLVEELGTDPGPELLKAHRMARDRSGAPVLRSRIVARRQLPGDAAEFVGRSAELEWLRERLAATATRPAARTAGTAVSIVGMGGVGKTLLAVHLAHQLIAAGRGADLQLYVELGDADPAAALAAILRVLEVTDDQCPPDLAGRAALYRDRLARRQALVLLDNVTSETQLRPLLPAGPGNVVLVTGRHLLALEGLEVLPLTVFEPVEAEQLLARIAGPERIARDSRATRQLTAMCGYLPQAVSLAARRLRARPSWGTRELVERLANAPDRLRELAAGTDQLRSTFGSSYQDLTDPERRLFRILGSLPADEVTPAAVATHAGLPVPQATRLLDRLADASLITVLSGDRYRVPGLLHEFARTLPSPSGRGDV